MYPDPYQTPASGTPDTSGHAGDSAAPYTAAPAEGSASPYAAAPGRPRFFPSDPYRARLRNGAEAAAPPLLVGGMGNARFSHPSADLLYDVLFGSSRGGEQRRILF